MTRKYKGGIASRATWLIFGVQSETIFANGYGTWVGNDEHYPPGLVSTFRGSEYAHFMKIMIRESFMWGRD